MLQACCCSAYHTLCSVSSRPIPGVATACQFLPCSVKSSALTAGVLPHVYRLALHVMCFSNARAIAGLWQHFVRYLRSFWDQSRLLPRMPPSTPPLSRRQPQQHAPVDSAARESAGDSALPRPDFSCCVLHQKLQMLNLCIQQAHGLQAHQPAQQQSQQVRTASPSGW